MFTIFGLPVGLWIFVLYSDCGLCYLAEVCHYLKHAKHYKSYHNMVILYFGDAMWGLGRFIGACGCIYAYGIYPKIHQINNLKLIWQGEIWSVFCELKVWWSMFHSVINMLYVMSCLSHVQCGFPHLIGYQLLNIDAWNKRFSQMHVPLVARCEPAGVQNWQPSVLYIF